MGPLYKRIFQWGNQMVHLYFSLAFISNQTRGWVICWIMKGLWDLVCWHQFGILPPGFLDKGESVKHRPFGSSHACFDGLKQLQFG